MAYTQWESRNIDKKKNIIEFRGTGDKPTGGYIGENSTLLDYDNGNKFYWKDGTWKPLKESSSSGSSGGEGLPADFPAEGSANANKFLGFDANGDYTAKDAPAGGGAEKFIVTLTQDAQTEAWTADKTIAEIVAADEANKVVVCKVVYAENVLPPFEVPFSAALTYAALFGGVTAHDKTEALVVFGMLDEGVTQWTVDTIKLGSSNEPLIVTMTAGATEGQFVGDKTFGEVYSAMSAGKNVVLSGTLGAPMRIVPSGIMLDGSTYKLTIVYNEQFVVLQGAEADYITVAGG